MLPSCRATNDLKLYGEVGVWVNQRVRPHDCPGHRGCDGLGRLLFGKMVRGPASFRPGQQSWTRTLFERTTVRFLDTVSIRILADEGPRYSCRPARLPQAGNREETHGRHGHFSRARGCVPLPWRYAGATPEPKLYESYGFRQEALRRGITVIRRDAIIMWNRGI